MQIPDLQRVEAHPEVPHHAGEHQHQAEAGDQARHQHRGAAAGGPLGVGGGVTGARHNLTVVGRGRVLVQGRGRGGGRGGGHHRDTSPHGGAWV